MAAVARPDGGTATALPPTLDTVTEPSHLQTTGIAPLDIALSGGLLCPGSLLVWGPPGSGKTRLALRICRPPVLLIGLEMPPSSYARYAGQMHLDSARIHYVSTLDDWLHLARAIGARSVLVDSLGEVSAPLATLRHLCRSNFNGVMCAIAHENSAGRARGGRALEHTTDTLLRVTRGTGSTMCVHVRKHRAGPPAAPVALPL